jgi:hypothetical protein
MFFLKRTVLFLAITMLSSFNLNLWAAPGKKLHSSYSHNFSASVNKDSYRRFVLPQLKSLTREFYFILKKLDPLNSPIIDLLQRLKRIQRALTSHYQTCLPKTNIEECNTKLKVIYDRAHFTNKIISKLQETKKLNLESIRLVDGLSIHSYQLLAILEKHYNSSKGPMPSFIRNDSQKVDNLIHKMSVNLEFLLTSRLQKGHKEQIIYVWTSFIGPIETYVLDQNNSKYLLKELEELNFSWNSFHMNIEKHRKDKNMKPVYNIIKTMRNRWNSILKIVLN